MIKNERTIAVLSPGIMGASLGGALKQHGCDVITDLTGRSEDTRARAEHYGLRALDSLNDVVAKADLILSVVPPAVAMSQAQAVLAALEHTDNRPAFAELNAVSPELAREIAAQFAGRGITYMDGGIIGAPPHQDLTRIYVCGQDCSAMLELDGMNVVVREVKGAIGQASALKMCFAGINKGTNALLAATMLAAEELGVAEDLSAELEGCQPATLERMRRVIPRLPSDAGRYVFEMEQIAETLRAVGVPGDFHDGAAEMMRRFQASPFGSETRETRDTSRSMEDTLKALVRKA